MTAHSATRHARCPVTFFDPDERAVVESLYASSYDGIDIQLALLEQFHGGLLDGSVVDAVFQAEGWLWPGEGNGWEP